ncbi:MAG: signal peptidase II [Deltaproteobacteria bacterium]|nr:signal peptidase II [Deltaproteobacteria bacterium]
MSEQAGPEAQPDEPRRRPVGQSLLLWRHRLGFLLLALAMVLALDQYSKLWVRDNLAAPIPATVHGGDVRYRGQRELVLVRGIFHLRYVENPAAAFSLLRSVPEDLRLPLLIGVNGLAMILLSVWLWRLRRPDGVLIAGLALVTAGVAGNLTDRLWHGSVIDFVVWMVQRWWPSVPEWPTFNLADIAIVCGTVCILVRLLVPFRSDLPEVAQRVLTRGR